MDRVRMMRGKTLLTGAALVAAGVLTYVAHGRRRVERRVHTAEEALWEWLARPSPAAFSRVQASIARAKRASLFDARPDCLSVLAMGLEETPPSCQPRDTRGLRRALCLLRRGQTTRAASLLAETLRGRCRSYLPGLLERWHRGQARPEAPR